MITISANVHINWGLGMFTLEPLGSEFNPLYNILGLPITDGHIVTFTTNDPINAPVPHRDLLMLQFFFIRVLRMAGRVGEDMLETFDSDDEVSLLAASNAGSTEEQTADELARSPPCHNGTTDLETSPPAPLADLVSGGATLVEQPQPKKRQNPFSSTRIRNFLSFLRRKIG
ncbi:hypothetical protein MMC31_004251 [Peltigera leucophlebia]|nr:hypothetical protein [Peltigera leucophlebia]